MPITSRADELAGERAATEIRTMRTAEGSHDRVL